MYMTTAGKRDLLMGPKRPAIEAKETYYRGHSRLTIEAKETYFGGKRDLLEWG
jgi:hypothetical protein